MYHKLSVVLLIKSIAIIKTFSTLEEKQKFFSFISGKNHIAEKL